MKIIFKTLLFWCLYLPIVVSAQELFPHAEPASTMPKGVVGLRFMYEGYKEIPSQRARYWNGFRIMYGATSKLTVMLTGSASNHHVKRFPKNLQTYFVSHHQKVYIPNPYLMEGLNLYAKFRCFSLDEKQKHIRIAFFGQVAKSFIPHDEAEPDLMADNTGIGGGIIGTILYKRFAISVTNGYINPFPYKDDAQKITFKSGKAVEFDVSAGYRIYPAKYSGYQNINVNVYAEFINKQYGAAEMTVNGKNFDFDIYQFYDANIFNSLQENKYSEFRGSIQLLFNSNNRLDLGVALPVLNRSYLHFYPMYFIQLQKYFYPGNKKVQIKQQTNRINNLSR